MMIREDIMKHKMDEILNDSLFYKNEDLLVKQNDITYHITSTNNQKNKEYLNISVLDLKECENQLKNHYNISSNEPLIIFKIDYMNDEINIPIIEYEIYHPITKQPLDLNICKNFPITLSYPVSINENELFKYDINSDYYNDKCFSYTTSNKTDITLNDRKNEYNNNDNLFLCEKNCNFTDYDKETKRASCECEPKTIFEYLFNFTIDKDKLFYKFIDFKNTTNLDVIFCYKTFFCMNGIKTNIGSYILIIIILINVIYCAIFIKIGYKKIDNQIKNILQMKYKNFTYKNNAINLNKNKIKGTNGKIDKNKKKVKSKKDNIYIFNKKRSFKNPPKRKYENRLLSSIKKDSSKTKIKSSFNNIHIFRKKNRINSSIIFKHKYKRVSFIDKEINSLVYEEALKYDKRTYIQYYISLLKLKHLLIFTFITKNDYNSRSIKICLFTFSFSLLYTINSFFFQDNTIHKIYEDNGIYDFVYQIPQIIYSTIISSILTILIKYFSLSDRMIIFLKNNDNNETLNNYSKNRKCLITKFMMFYMINFLFLFMFWYYLGCFCAVFKNTQIYLIKDALFSFSLSFIYLVILYLFPGIFRIPALRIKNKNKNKKCLYLTSKIIQLI